MSVERLFLWKALNESLVYRWELSYKIFKTVIDLVTIIILYVLLLALLVGVANVLLNIKLILFRTFGAFLIRYYLSRMWR